MAENLEKAYVKLLPIELVELNEGQIEGVPTNPRKWDDEQIDKLRKSIEEDAEYMQYNPVQVFPQDGKYIVISGNMRTYVCKQEGWKELPCVVFREDTPTEVLRARVIKPNTTFGDWDWLALEEWDQDELSKWGLDGFFSSNSTSLMDGLEQDPFTEAKKNESGFFEVTLLFPIEYEKYKNDIVNNKDQIIEKAIEICQDAEAK